MRVKRLKVVPEFLVMMFQAEDFDGQSIWTRVSENGLPKDAKLVEARQHPEGDITLIIESAEYDEVPTYNPPGSRGAWWDVPFADAVQFQLSTDSRIAEKLRFEKAEKAARYLNESAIGCDPNYCRNHYAYIPLEKSEHEVFVADYTAVRCPICNIVAVQDNETGLRSQWFAMDGTDGPMQLACEDLRKRPDDPKHMETEQHDATEVSGGCKMPPGVLRPAGLVKEGVWDITPIMLGGSGPKVIAEFERQQDDPTPDEPEPKKIKFREFL